MSQGPLESIPLTQAVHDLFEPKNINFVFTRLIKSRLRS